MVLDTPSAAEAKLLQRRGRTGRGQRVRTLPPVQVQTPYGIGEAEPDEEEYEYEEYYEK